MNAELNKIRGEHGSAFPYACDAIAHYIFGEKSDDNIVVRALKGVYGIQSQIDGSELSSYMLSHEYSYLESIEEINYYVQHMTTVGGDTLNHYY